MTRVAVIIVTWNAEAHIQRCLQSISMQKRLPERVIIFDNASTDGTVALIKRIMPKAEVIESDENIGFAAGNNLAISAAKDCQYVALLNPDAFPAPNWLEQLLKAAENHPKYAMYASLMYNAETGMIDGAGDEYHRSGLAWRRYFNCDPAEVNLREEEVFGPCAAAALYKREQFEAVGGFDESFFCYFEDVDLAFRMQLQGNSCLFVPTAVVDHVGSAFTGIKSRFAIYHGYRNLLWTYVKNMPGKTVWLYLPLNILMTTILLLGFTMRGRGSAIFKAAWDAFCRLGRVRKQRKQIQKNISVKPRHLLDRISRKNIFLVLLNKNK